MANLDVATQKWAQDAAQGVQDNWKPGVDRAAAQNAYCAGVARFMGGSAPRCSQVAGPNWQRGVAATPTAEVVAGIQRAVQTGAYANGLRRAFG